jgi:hypothetical protein
MADQMVVQKVVQTVSLVPQRASLTAALKAHLRVSSVRRRVAQMAALLVHQRESLAE